MRFLIHLAFCAFIFAGALPAGAEDQVKPSSDDVIDGDEELQRVDEVVVTGSRTEHRLSDAPVATEVITRKDIETSGAVDVSDLLASHPGVDIYESFRGSGVRLQGLDSKHVLILVDGERVTGRIGGVIDLRRFLLEDIDHIEIVKGASSALYGSDAMGGVINIITRKASSPLGAELYASYGSFNATDVNGVLSVSNDHVNSRTSAGFHQIDAYDLMPEDEATSGSAISEFNVANRTEFELSEAFSLMGTIDYLQRDMQGVDSNAAGAVFDRRNLTETLSTTLRPDMKLPWLSQVSLIGRFSLFRDQYLYDQRNSNALDQYQETLEQLAQLTAQYDHLLFDQHLLSVGATSSYEFLESERLVDNTGDRIRGGIFIQDEWTILDTPFLVLVPGARYDFDSQFGSYPTPKIALRYDPFESLVLRASYGTGYRAPVFKELLLLFENPSVGYVVSGNPELKPEMSQSYNVGGEWWPVYWMWLTLNIFYNDIDNLITTNSGIDDGSGGPVRFYYDNIASAQTRGIETSVRIPIGQYGMLQTGYALTDTWDESTDRAIEGRALHRLTFDLRFRHKSWGTEGTFRGNFVGERPFYLDTDGDGVEETLMAEPFSNIDLRIGQRLFGATKAFVGIENLLDAGNVVYLPIQPRTFYGGINQRF